MTTTTIETQITTAEIAKIRRDDELQARAQMDQSAVSEYSKVMLEARKEGKPNPFDPVSCYYDPEEDVYWLFDGFHRIAAAVLARETHFRVEHAIGKRRDAFLHALAANKNHGVRRTTADKRRAITLMLSDIEFAKWSDRQIADWLGVSAPTVGTIRSELAAQKGDKFLHLRNGDRRGKDGKSYKAVTVYPATPNEDPVIEIARNVALYLVTEKPYLYGSGTIHHNGEFYGYATGREAILNEGEPHQRSEKVTQKHLGIIMKDAGEVEQLYRFDLDELKSWLLDLVASNIEYVSDHPLIGKSFLLVEYSEARYNAQGMYRLDKRSKRDWGVEHATVVKDVFRQRDGQQFAMVENKRGNTVSVVALADIEQATDMPVGLHYRLHEQDYGLPRYGSGINFDGLDWRQVFARLDEQFEAKWIFFLKEGPYDRLHFTAGRSVDALRHIDGVLLGEIEETAVAWITPSQLKQVAPGIRIVTFETPNQIVHSDVTRLTKQLVASDGKQWMLRSNLPPAPEAAPAAPVEFQLGDTVKPTSTALNYGIGKIVKLTGPGDPGSADYVMVKFDAYSRELPHLRRTLQLVGRATVVQSEFNIAVGDWVRVDGQGQPGIIKEVKPEANSAKVTRPNPSNPDINMTHWTDAGRLQKVPAPQPEQTEEEFPFAVGDQVRVVGGPDKGLVAEVVEIMPANNWVHIRYVHPSTNNPTTSWIDTGRLQKAEGSTEMEEPTDPRLAAILGDDPAPVEEISVEEPVLQDEDSEAFDYSALSEAIAMLSGFMEDSEDADFDVLEEYGHEDILRQVNLLRYFADLAQQRYLSVKISNGLTTHAED